MEQINSNTAKKRQQIAIFQRFATILSENDKIRTASRDSSSQIDEVDATDKRGQPVLRYDDFLSLVNSSKTLYSKFTDHSFNLNQIPLGTFGCIFFALDEGSKGYLSINDWFYFNNILECDNYNLIILFEFFRKFDKEVGTNSGDSATLKKFKRGGPALPNEMLSKSINFSNKFLSFDDLLLNVNQFKKTINLLHEAVNDDFAKHNNLFLDWEDFRFLKYYECYHKNQAYLSLNSIVTIIQNDLKNERLFVGFQKLAQMDNTNHVMALNRNQLVYLLKTYYSHRVSADIFDSMNLSNTILLRSDNHSIPFNMVKDTFYLFQNFDLLNQFLHRYAEEHEISEKDMKTHVINKKDFMNFLNRQYDKVTNINEFSPAQINLLFSIVANAKENNRKIKKMNCFQDSTQPHHRASDIDWFIHNEYMNSLTEGQKTLISFNKHYSDIFDGFSQDYNERRITTIGSSLFSRLFGAKEDKATMRSNLTVDDFMRILNPNYLNDLVHRLEMQKFESDSIYRNYYFYPIFDSFSNFFIGSIAGCIGATAVYPVDFIKTRMQVQRSLSQYKNSLDCFLKITSKEGIRGLYSGLGPQLIGVAPEKAIKLTINDFMRNKLTDKRGKLHPYGEILAGATAGACQVLFTNPLEIIKIRLQVRSEYIGENASKSKITAMNIIRTLGLSGLYKGVTACLMRDVPFSAIYFPTYAHLKKDLFNFDPKDRKKRNKLKTWELLAAGALAGMPAAYLTTPFDVIKTRLQIDPRKGETHYTGIIHAFKTILREESFRSFFKGGAARVLRSSPQFGFTLAAYELFKGLLPSPSQDVDNSKGSLSHSSVEDKRIFKHNFENYYYKSCQVAKTFIDLDNNFSKFDYSVYLKFSDYLNSLKPR